ncbi:Uncharacterised protein [Mycobacteroides abscessus subsp. abscessus]|nr:Uncharacterised protein [Mycobacteroides abscessus subsp. abscessus]
MDSALWPAPQIRMSWRPSPPPSSAANQSRSSGSPPGGGRSHASGRRAARASDAVSIDSGCKSGCRYPPLRSTTSAALGAKVLSSPGASNTRRIPGGDSSCGPSSSAVSCHEVSPGRGTGRFSVRKDPAPGRDSIRPCCASSDSASATVLALT